MAVGGLLNRYRTCVSLPCEISVAQPITARESGGGGGSSSSLTDRGSVGAHFCGGRNRTGTEGGGWVDDGERK